MEGRILLVDDDHRMLDVLGDLLVDEGFDVAPPAATADAARRGLAADPRISVVVIDYVLGPRDPDGIDLGIELAGERPHLQVVIFSSLLDRNVEERARTQRFYFIDKLRGLDALCGLLRTLARHKGPDA